MKKAKKTIKSMETAVDAANETILRLEDERRVLAEALFDLLEPIIQDKIDDAITDLRYRLF